MPLNFTPTQPVGVAVGNTNRQFLTDLQLLVPHYYDKLIRKYGNENYAFLLPSIGLKRRNLGKAFYHWETASKLHASISNSAAITPAGAGQSVTVTLASGDHYENGTMSPIRVGETVRVDSSGFEGKIISINTATPYAHTATILPLKSTVTFTSAGSTQLLAGEILTFQGNTEAGENSSATEGLTNLVNSVSNTTTEIRDDWPISDWAMIEQIQFEINGQPYITYKGLKEMVMRFMNNYESKLMIGDTADNLAAYGGSMGTQGLIPRVLADGQVFQYTPGSLSVSSIQSIIRGIDFYGGAQEYHWLSDSYQYQEIMNQLFQTFAGGGIIWDFAGGNEQASINYGFKTLTLDEGYTIHFKKYRPFNSEVKYGRASSNSQFRNAGILIPMKQWTDPKTQDTIPSLQVVYNQVEGKPEIMSIPTGMLAERPTDNQAHLVVTNLAYAGLQVFAANQYVFVTH